jgi:ABC-type sugar transport system substrate-binding protein
VLTPASQWGTQLSAQLVTACAGKDSCNVGYIAGAFGVAFDDMALADLGDLETAHPNIHLVATDQAFYDQATAYTVAQQMIAAHPELTVIVGAGDQMAEGAEHALADAGKPPGAVGIIGAGAGAYAIQAVLDGRWYGTYMALPADEGQLGAVIAIRAAHHQPIADPGIDPVARRGFPAFFTIANQALFAGFVPQWPG